MSGMIRVRDLAEGDLAEFRELIDGERRIVLFVRGAETHPTDPRFLRTRLKLFRQFDREGDLRIRKEVDTPCWTDGLAPCWRVG